MELKEFIKEAIKGISLGIIESQRELSEFNVNVNPTSDVNGMMGGARGTGAPPLRNKVQSIEMSVSVVVVEETNVKSKGSLRVLSFGADIDAGGNSYSNKTVQEIKFSIPVAYPNS